MESTYIVFPITITMGAIFMQLGSIMIEKIHPRIQMAIGGSAVVLPLFVCSYSQNYYLFIFMYAVVLGFGFGVLYMVSLRNAWQFFPNKKGMLSGLIMSFYSVGAIVWVLITKSIANPNNLKPDDHQQFGDVTEDFFSQNSPVVANVP
jgi:MFS family permease